MTQQHQEDTQVQRAEPSETYDDDRTAVASRHRADVRTSAATEVDPSYRGFKGGAAFFGWLVAIGLIALLTGIVGAIAAAVDYAGRIDWNNTNADTLGIASGVILLVILAIAYYNGGDGAGRPGRLRGARQGVGGLGIRGVGAAGVAGVAAPAG